MNGTSTRRESRFHVCGFLTAGVAAALLVGPVSAADYYVDATGGGDGNAGTAATSPWRTVSRAMEQGLAPGDRVLLKRGESWAEDVRLRASGVPGSPVTIGAYGDGDAPIIRSLKVSGDNTVVEDLTVDHRKIASDAVEITHASNCVLRRLTLRNGTQDGVDANDSDNLLIDSCHIHHFLKGSFADQEDAHGIVVTETQGVTIRNTEIHHVSGDSFQTDPDRDLQNHTNHVVVENCHFWTGPLTEDFNDGWRRTDHLPPEERQYPGENAIDTKVARDGWETTPRMQITLRNIRAHGWIQDGFMPNKAAFVFKEKVEVLADGITVHDCEIAFRVRGTRGNANLTLKNAVIHGCEKAFRAEDDVSDLKVYHTTFGTSLPTLIDFAGGDGGRNTWEFRNNAFVGRKHAVAAHPTNRVVPADSLDANFTRAAIGDYHLVDGSVLIEAGAALATVTSDRDGRSRTPPVDVGAYEFSTSGEALDPPPSPPTNVRVVR